MKTVRSAICFILVLALVALSACTGSENGGEVTVPDEPGTSPGYETTEAPSGAETGETSRLLPAHALAVAAYPLMAAYPDESKYIGSDGQFDSDGWDKVWSAWNSDRNKQLDRASDEKAESMSDFLTRSIRRFLSGKEGENAVYSPLNVYMALAMLAETTDGESRAQILDLLGAKDIEALRSQANALWNAHYCDDGATTSVLANSLWLSDEVEAKKDTVVNLAENYYASTYKGKTGSEEFDNALRDWINEQTGGLLKDQASGLKLDPSTVMALASTIYYRAKWANRFTAEETQQGEFRLPSGETATCDFMKQTQTKDYFWVDGFSAVSLELENSGRMWFILPDEGTSPEELLENGSATDFILSDGGSAESKYLVVHMSVPKFDVASDTDLTDGLSELGIKDVFDDAVSDFSPLTDMTGIYLSDAKHAARVKIDEEGVIAAAYTVMVACGAGMPPEEEVDFVLDRPFIFSITAEDGLPLFVGEVNRP